MHLFARWAENISFNCPHNVYVTNKTWVELNGDDPILVKTQCIHFRNQCEEESSHIFSVWIDEWKCALHRGNTSNSQRLVKNSGKRKWHLQSHIIVNKEVRGPYVPSGYWGVDMLLVILVFVEDEFHFVSSARVQKSTESLHFKRFLFWWD